MGSRQSSAGSGTRRRLDHRCAEGEDEEAEGSLEPGAPEKKNAEDPSESLMGLVLVGFCSFLIIGSKQEQVCLNGSNFLKENLDQNRVSNVDGSPAG